MQSRIFVILRYINFYLFFAASQSVIMDESHVTLDETGFSEADLNVTSNDTSMYYK